MEAERLDEEPPSEPPGAGALRIIPFQPEPRQTLVAYLDGQTAVSRLWDDGDTLRCRLCLACKASDNNCLVIVPFLLPRASAPSLSTRSLRRTDDRGLRRAEGDA